jgi:serine/threonine-protein kinase SRPK3
MHEGNDTPVKLDKSASPLGTVVMSGAIGGSKSKEHSPKTEKDHEDKHKQREKSAYVLPHDSMAAC